MIERYHQRVFCTELDILEYLMFNIFVFSFHVPIETTDGSQSLAAVGAVGGPSVDLGVVTEGAGSRENFPTNFAREMLGNG